jgi:2-hydroxycyclohexanecarboxyl-CoA dehydrogenase
MARTALVTGAAAGIGRACALRLAQEGFCVGVLDLDLEAGALVVSEIVAAGGRAVALKADVAERAQVRDAVAELRERLGPITVLVNNAAISGIVRFQELDDSAWDRMMAINARGAFVVTHVVLPDMEAAKWGRIINMSSSSAQTGGASMAHYAASKGAVIALTRSLALELGPLGITANVIAPGAVMNTAMWEANQQRFTVAPEVLAKSVPVRRNGEPEDIAHAVAWLASEQSGYVTGQTISVNGGRYMS